MRSLLGLLLLCAVPAEDVPSCDSTADLREGPPSCGDASGSCKKSRSLAEEAGQETGFSMMQHRALDRRHRTKKPWESLKFTAVAYHKSGVFLMQELQRMIFDKLNASDEVYGLWQQPCFNEIVYNEEWCRHQTAPVRTLVDIYGPDMERNEREDAKPNGMRVAGSVRDPLAMIASAYCYHHRGEELGYTTLWPPGLIMTMGPEDGVKFAAERMLTTVRNMTAIFANPAEDTIRLSFENFSASSESFDLEVARLVDFWLRDLIDDKERELILENCKQADLHRNRDVLSQHHDVATHSNDKECEAKAMEATKKLPPDLLQQYRTFQAQLGYPTDS
ncbi:NSUN2 [Symbiodinium necroappetens]|uniref:NSUN2 protein n=1 Tax=Symbiodinium necroappetens TaxID=1628268 RepID=A0A812S333_9DINO|nr:NSUN2 [Symbiodinium necroappetens]